MDYLNRISGLINEAKKKSGRGKAVIPSHHEKKGGKKSPLGKANRFDHDAVSESKAKKEAKKEVVGTNDKQVYVYDPKTGNLTPDKRRARRSPSQTQKVDASTEIANILNLIKEAYQDDLISEEAFLAIADPIMRSLMEVTFPDTWEKEDLDDAEKEGPKKVNKPSPPKNPTQVKRSFYNRARRSRRRDRG